MQVYQKLRKELEGLGYTVLSREIVMSMSTLSLNVQEWLIRLIQISLLVFTSMLVAALLLTVLVFRPISYEEAGWLSFLRINPYWHNHPDRISESNRLAADIHSSLLAETGAKDVGLLQSSFCCPRETDKTSRSIGIGLY